MKNALGILSELIQWFEKFIEANPDTELDIQSFIIWLNTQLFDDVHSDHANSHHVDLDMELTFLLTLQNRYYRTYAKEALNDSDLSSPEGFSFLYHLNLVNSYRKMELIKIHHLEPPSGIEVLKRLLKRGFIEEYDDPNDGRAKRICITESGRRKIHEILPKMEQVFARMSADMSISEKMHVVSFLKKMNDFHERKISSPK